MPVLWSRVHAQMGEAPAELTFAMLEGAVNLGVAEAEDLDWKVRLPGREDGELDEFAKDMAAMANTSGGLIVYGVGEERGTGRAASLATVDAAEGTQRRLRALAASRIQPPVLGLEFVPLSSDDGGTTVLVVSVPRGPDAPHVVGQNNRLGVPYRSGPETHWMRERELERAYATRFARRAEDHERLVDMIADISDQLDPAYPWIVAVARPRTPRPMISSVPTRADITGVLQDAATRSLQIVPKGSPDRFTLLDELGNAALNPRVGLRRWVVRPLRSDSPDDRSHFGHVELHHDGSIGYAAALEGWYEPLFTDRYHAPAGLVESFMTDLVALTESYARQVGEQRSYGVRIELIRADSAKPFAVIGPQRYGTTRTGDTGQIQGTRMLRRCTPILTELPVLTGPDDLRDTARALAQDTLHQFELDTLLLLNP